MITLDYQHGTAAQPSGQTAPVTMDGSIPTLVCRNYSGVPHGDSGSLFHKSNDLCPFAIVFVSLPFVLDIPLTLAATCSKICPDRGAPVPSHYNLNSSLPPSTLVQCTAVVHPDLAAASCP